MRSRRKLVVALALGGVLLVMAIAFVAGGGGGGDHHISTTSAGDSGGSGSQVPGDTAAAHRAAPSPAGRAPAISGAAGSGTASGAAGEARSLEAPQSPVGAASRASNGDVLPATDVTASRVVKQGTLDLTVPRGQVSPTVAKLTSLAANMGGYIQSSQSDSSAGYPIGSLTLRVPTMRFDQTVADAEHLGTVTSVTTSAQDVTGKYVDLNARRAALERARSTYLTILSRATTIASTLSVQQRVDDIQQQIEQLQGQLKVLRNQSSDATLDVSVMQQGAPVTGPRPAHHAGGIGGAWHRSIQRFSRGFDAIVAALGPLLLALLVVAAIALVGRFGYRGLRRTAS